MSPRTVLIMAGGTGGHVFPALAAAEVFRQQGFEVEWLGTARGIEARLVPAAEIKLHCLNIAGLRGKGLKSLLLAPFKILSATWQAIRLLRQLRPVCVLGMGGFAAGPGGLAAWLLRKPLVIHEQNAVAGTTNRMLAPLARRVLSGYPISLGKNKQRYIGNPVRAEIARLPQPEQRGVGRAARLRLLVLGGSLGAKPINDLLPAALAALPAAQRPEVWHQAGEAHAQVVAEDYRQRGVAARSEAFVGDMAAAYGWADLVICRAGALTVAELAAAGVASVLVPLPHAIDDHQTANARWLAEQQAALLLPQSQLSVEALVGLLQQYQAEPASLLAMANKARSLAKADVAEQVVQQCLEAANG